MRAAIAAVTVLLAACAGQNQPAILTTTAMSDQAVRSIVRAALEADASGAPADTLYMLGATIVADGRVRVVNPRFAGIQRGGQISITGLQAEIASGLAWAITDYRWIANDRHTGAIGRATLILETLGSGWKIKHVHSSSIQP